MKTGQFDDDVMLPSTEEAMDVAVRLTSMNNGESMLLQSV
jgi:hypothetical protein